MTCLSFLQYDPQEHISVHFQHYSDVMMSVMATQVTVISIVCTTVGSGADQREHQSSTLLAFVSGIQR